MTSLHVAVVGANGFIAKHLIKKLRATPGIHLVLFGRSNGKAVDSGLPYKTIDFNNEQKLIEDFTGIDVVYHMVSETIPSTSWEDPMIEIEKNLIPFTRFLNVISKLNVKKIAYVSSAGTVYGVTSGKVHEASDKKPFSPYGIMKLAMENLLHYYKTKFDLNYDVYRVSNVYGEGQVTAKGLGIINTFLEKIILENKVRIFGDGESTRNYIYAEDVAELLSLSVKDPGTSDVYNVSSNSTLSINDLIKVLKETVSENFEVQYEQSRQSDISYIDLDNSKIIGRLPGFEFTDFREGIRKTYAALKIKKIKS